MRRVCLQSSDHKQLLDCCKCVSCSLRLRWMDLWSLLPGPPQTLYLCTTHRCNNDIAPLAELVVCVRVCTAGEKLAVSAPPGY
ncbi:Hypothetical predicted protein [Xyrichtys novacula]|uniref:Uncharacterized protein n=1 Tax=Xyrichtys novacula TaxID=13765 RepID=A0AAV1F725_XYRNO|nr:Hypothetical predicted protein [Xyrichtys novacula]